MRNHIGSFSRGIIVLYLIEKIAPRKWQVQEDVFFYLLSLTYKQDNYACTITIGDGALDVFIGF